MNALVVFAEGSHGNDGIERAKVRVQNLSRSRQGPFLDQTVMCSLCCCRAERGERVDKRGEAALKEREETAEERQRQEGGQDITI